MSHEDPVEDPSEPRDRPGVGDLRELGESALDALVEGVGRGVGRLQERTPLRYDLLESEDAYLVVFDAPGATAQDVDVRFEGGEVRVRVDRFREFREGYEMRFPGRGLSLEGSATLPRDADVEAGGSSATLTEDGTLQVRVPKSGDSRRITVEDEVAGGDEAGGEAESAGKDDGAGESTGGSDSESADGE